jgi:hypothetical protein
MTMAKKTKHTRQKQTAQPHWQPIEMLPTLAQHIDGMLESSQEQYETLLEARPKPYVLDDYTVRRVISAFTTQVADLWVFDEQLQRWLSGSLTTEQQAEVTRLAQQMRRLREVDHQVLALARELSKGTIEKVMAKSDEELGLEFLMGMFKEGRE